jgi:hypothetical protein
VVKFQIQDTSQGETLIQRSHDGADRLLDASEQSPGLDIVASSDRIAEIVDLSTLWVTEQSLSDSLSEVVAPPQDHIAEPNPHSRIYHTLWGESIRRNLPY